MLEKIRLSNTAMVVLAICLIFMWVGYILRSGEAANRSYELQTLRIKLTDIQNENTFLHLDIAHLKSPERIQEIATKKLGMVVPDKFFFANDN